MIWMCRKAYRMTITQHVLLFSHYYTHYFHYYAHYFQCLGRVRLEEIVTSTLQRKYSGCMSNTKLRDGQASSYRCQRSSVCAVLKLSFTLFDYYANYFSYYTHYLKNTSGVSGPGDSDYSWRKFASMISRGGTEAANHYSQAAGAEAANHP